MKKIIIFDLDGVLFDSINLSMNTMSESYPGFTEEMYKELLCGNVHEEIQKITLPPIKRTEDEEMKHQLLFAQKKLEIAMYPGAKELLQDLHTEGYTLVLNSSAYKKNVHPLLERHHLLSLFDFIATAEISKSKNEKFEMIAERYNLSSEDFLFVTDTVGDIREAELANIPTIAVTWGVHDRLYFDRLKNTKHLLAIVDTFKELKDCITARAAK